MAIQLSDHFSYARLLRFTFSSIVMMVFTSIYGVVDGFFVSNYVGKLQFAAVSFIVPYLMLFGAIGFIFGTGGSALVAKIMGEGDREKANRVFSLIVYASILCSMLCAAAGMLLIRPVAAALGAEAELLEYAVLYGRIILTASPAYALQVQFQSFFVTAEKPQLGLRVTVLAGVVNMALDALLIAVLQMGIVGAALATAVSQTAGGVVPLFYFFRPNTSLLRLGKTRFDPAVILRTCANGSSEFMSSISMSLVSMLYNIQLLRLSGEDGVAAYGVLMYINMIFISIFIGYSIGTAPLFSYHYGAANARELKNLLKKSFVIIGAFSVAMFLSGELLARPLSRIFVSYDDELLQMTIHAFSIFAFSFLPAGMAVFGSSFFTALNNGLVSAVISFLRTVVFQASAVLLLPLLWGLDGIWASTTASEALAAAVCLIFIIALRKRYHYLGREESPARE